MDIAFSDLDAEKLAVSYVLKSLENFEDCRSKVKPSMLEDKRLQVILDECQKYYLKYGGIPNEKGFEQILSESMIPVDKKQNLVLLFINLQNVATTVTKDQFLSCLDILSKLEKRRQLFSITQEIKDGLQSGVKEDEIIAKVLSKAYDTEATIGAVAYEGSVKDSFEERLKLYHKRKSNPELFKGLPYGISVLDNLTSGMMPGEFSLVFARTGAGKTRFLHSVAYNIFAKGHNVMYVTVEMPHTQVERMFDSRHFLISNTGLRQGSLSQEEEKKFFFGKPSIANCKGDLYMVDIPENCSVASIIPVIRRYKARKKLDAIVVDYINIMTPSTKITGELPVRYGEISRELKVLARTENVATLSAIQANRGAASLKTEDVGTENVSYSDQVAWHADFLLFLKKAGLEGEIQKELEGIVVKYRDGKNQLIKLGVAWDYSFVGDMEDILNQQSEQFQVSVRG